MKSLLENIDLMAYKINFNFKKNTVYHSFFGLLISIGIYGFLIILTRYFAKDFVNKTNPRVIYQENEFTDSFEIPLEFIMKQYYYAFKFQTDKNIYNISSTEEIRILYNITNDFFNLSIGIEYFNVSLSILNMFEKIDILSRRKKFDNGSELFENFIQKNLSVRQKFNLTISNRIYKSLGKFGILNNTSLIKFEEGKLYDNFNVTIQPNMMIYLIYSHQKNLFNYF